MTATITACRLCGNTALHPVARSAELALSGLFPASAAVQEPRGPIELVRCDREGAPDACGLVQLRHVYDPAVLYGPDYAYRSASDPAMARHLAGVAGRIRRLVTFEAQDVLLDIGSNDATLLACFAPPAPALLGVDPLAERLRRFYRPDMRTVSDFFSVEALRARYGAKRVRAVTSLGVLDCVADPLAFAVQVRDVLDDEGIWCFEQSYLPTLLQRGAYDAFGHERCSYWSVHQVRWLAERAGLKILDIFTSDLHGGSFTVTVGRMRTQRAGPPSALAWYLETEASRGLDRAAAWEAFERTADDRKMRLLALLDQIRGSSARLVAWGATERGSILLQSCGIGVERIDCVLDCDDALSGRFLPGTKLEVVAESRGLEPRPDFILVLPWHQREALALRHEYFLRAGGKLIFPLPEVEIVSA